MVQTLLARGAYATFAAAMAFLFAFSGQISASTTSSSFDCGSLEGLRVLDETLKSQPDGGWELFGSLSTECQDAYVAAQSVSHVEVVIGDQSVDTGLDANPEAGASATSSAAASCTAAWVSAYHYTYLGNVAYRYVFQDYFCFNGSTVTSHTPNHWIDNVDPNYYWRGGSVLSEQWIGTGYWTEMQGRVENCVFQYGCVGNAHPGGWIQTFGSGYWDGNAWAQ